MSVTGGAGGTVVLGAHPPEVPVPFAQPPVLLLQPVSQVGSQAKRLRNRRCSRPSRQKLWQGSQGVEQLFVAVCSQQPVLHSEAKLR